MKRRKYCIFNKQYTKEDYERLVPAVIEKMQQTGEWGEFFSLDSSPFPYNHSIALDFLPLAKKEVQETKHWLRMLNSAFTDKLEATKPLLQEAHELTLIFQKIGATSRRNEN